VAQETRREPNSMGDLNTLLERLVALRNTIIADGVRCGVPFTEKDNQTLFERTKSEGTSFCQVTLPLLGKALDIGLVSGVFKNIAHIRCKRDTCLPVFCHSVFREIFHTDGILLSKPNLQSIFFLRQVLLLDSKLLTEVTSEQEVLSFQEFCFRQRKLRRIRIPTGNPVLIRASLLLGRVLADLDLTDIQPGHGPGGVADRLNKFERWRFKTWPKKAERWYRHEEYGSLNSRSRSELTPPIFLDKTETRCCLVPKDFKGPRLISAEPTVNQYLQQGQMKKIMSYVDNHALLSKSIKLRDQTFNQEMCRRAWKDGLVTLDLSNASDNLSATLVWYLLSKVPRLRSQLFCTRSDMIKHNELSEKIVAFAPMGSAVCFPIETLVFWALTMASCTFVTSFQRTYTSNRHISDWTETEIASSIAVFGDDIIVPDYAFDTLRGTLVSVGCEVNESKTCYRTPFRESCGSEWMFDTDITITRNKGYQYDATKKLSDYPGLLDLQRKFFLGGLASSAALCLDWAREIFPVATIGVSKIPRITTLFASGPYGQYSRSAVSEGLRWEFGLVGERTSGEYGRYVFSHRLERSSRERIPFDTYPAALGWYTSLDSGVPTRWNRSYHCSEYRLPCVFQRTSEWSQTSSDEFERILEKYSKIPHQLVPDIQKQIKADGYARLLARLAGDSVDRIAIRYLTVKMAWSNIDLFS